MTETKLGDGIKKNNTIKATPYQKRNNFLLIILSMGGNKPKELVDRLLWSSKVAGHTGHDNEIMSIIEELREWGIIY